MQPPTSFADLPHGTESILFVDDDDSVRGSLSRVLEHLGYTVAQARGAMEAVLLNESARHDLVISDAQLQGMHGPALVAQLRLRCPDLRAMIISGHDVRDLEELYGHVNGVRLLQKPIRSAELAIAVREVLDD